MTNCNIDYEGLKRFLETLTYQGIKDGDLLKGHARPDIEMFYQSDEDKAGITLNQVIEYNTPYLVDVIGNDLSVCVLTKRKYKTPNGRVIGCKFDKTIIENCRKTFGSPLNGYWIIPERFRLKLPLPF